jgi:cytochrome c oxidase cbb3-type subunit III
MRAGCCKVSFAIPDSIMMGHPSRTLCLARRTFFAAAGILFFSNLISSAGVGPRETAASQNTEQRPVLGRQIFENRCAGCHGLDGRGGERAPDIATRARTRRQSDASITHAIRVGIPSAGMPAFPTLDDSSLRALVAYLRFLQGRTGVAKLPGDPARGKSLFFGKARCSECHTLAGAGGFLASDLSSYALNHEPGDIRQAILNPAKSGLAAVLTAATMRDGNEYSGVVRNEDNFSLQLQTADGAFQLFLKSEIASMVRENTTLMPSDYASTLSVADLNDLIGFLMSTNGGKVPRAAKKTFKEDEENE